MNSAPSDGGDHAGLVERLKADIENIQWGDRPLPWVVHTGCSYRRIASEPTLESGHRSFPDGNVLHAYNQRSDGHPDLSMGERELEALVRLINALPAAAQALTAQAAENAALRERVAEALRQIEKYAEFFCDEDFDPTVDTLRALLATPEQGKPVSEGGVGNG